jgi:hypothetical protein
MKKINLIFVIIFLIVSCRRINDKNEINYTIMEQNNDVMDNAYIFGKNILLQKNDFYGIWFYEKNINNIVEIIEITEKWISIRVEHFNEDLMDYFEEYVMVINDWSIIINKDKGTKEKYKNGYLIKIFNETENYLLIYLSNDKKQLLYINPSGSKFEFKRNN